MSQIDFFFENLTNFFLNNNMLVKKSVFFFFFLQGTLHDKIYL